MVIDFTKMTTVVAEETEIPEEDLDILFLKVKELELQLEVILVERLLKNVLAS